VENVMPFRYHLITKFAISGGAVITGINRTEHFYLIVSNSPNSSSLENTEFKDI
jgi:hypothetical protein